MFQETYLYVNRDATHGGQYINTDTHGKMLSTALISAPVRKQVNKDISIRHPFPAVQPGGNRSARLWWSHFSSSSNFPEYIPLITGYEAALKRYIARFPYHFFPTFFNSDHICNELYQKCVVFNNIGYNVQTVLKKNEGIFRQSCHHHCLLFPEKPDRNRIKEKGGSHVEPPASSCSLTSQ